MYLQKIKGIHFFNKDVFNTPQPKVNKGIDLNNKPWFLHFFEELLINNEIKNLFFSEKKYFAVLASKVN